MNPLLAFLLLLISYASSVPLPFATPFNYNVSNTGYIIQGNFYIRITGLPPFPVTPTTLVIDPQHNRMGFDWTTSGGGKILLFDHYTYHFGITGAEQLCFTVPNFGFVENTAGYATAVSQPDSVSLAATYNGLVQDVEGCGHLLSVSIKRRLDIIKELSFAQRIPYNFTGTPACESVDSALVYDLTTVDRTSNRDSFFQYPASCNTPIDWCTANYPPGNPCVF